MIDKCPLRCESDVQSYPDPATESLGIICPACGKFRITYGAISLIETCLADEYRKHEIEDRLKFVRRAVQRSPTGDLWIHENNVHKIAAREESLEGKKAES
jgi:hypothetical protein